MELFKNLGVFLKKGKLKELTLTTNGSQLEKYAEEEYGGRDEEEGKSMNTKLSVTDEKTAGDRRTQLRFPNMVLNLPCSWCFRILPFV